VGRRAALKRGASIGDQLFDAHRGGLEHGEAPLDGLRREVAEETGLTIDDVSLRGVLSDLWALPDGAQLHTVRIVYRIGAWHGELRAETVGSSDHAEWVPRAALDGLPLVAYVTEALDQFS